MEGECKITCNATTDADGGLPPPPTDNTFFKILTDEEFAPLKDKIGVEGEGFPGTAFDLKDGFIHFSIADELQPTLDRYFGGRSDLVVLTIDLNSTAEGNAVLAASPQGMATVGDVNGPRHPFQYDWVASRKAYFPHLSVPLPLSTVTAIRRPDPQSGKLVDA